MSKLLFTIISVVLALFARLPLPIAHGLGRLIGWLIYLCSPSYANQIKQNIKQANITQASKSDNNLLSNIIAESGKAILETLLIWLRPNQHLLPLVKKCDGWDQVEIAINQGKGLIFLTPHLGCFEITSRYYGAHHPMTVLYRAPRKAWLMPLINIGRERGGITLAPANAKGVKQLLQALKRGEAIGMLPDQAPLEGEGEWAPFFGRQAYTMTLASKLAQKTGAQVFMAFGERLSWGRGYHIHIRPIEMGGINSAERLNSEIERTITRCPEQYLWMYNRYKVRNQPPPPPIK